MRTSEKIRVTFGQDEIYGGKLYRKAADINFFKDRSNFAELEKIFINSLPDENLLENINELLIEKPSLIVDISLNDPKEFNLKKISAAENLLLDFNTVNSKVDLSAFKKLKKLNISSLDGSCKNYIDSIAALEKLQDLRLGHFKSDLGFLNGLPDLKRLDLKSVKSPSGLEFLKNKQALKYLIIYQGGFAGYKGIENCSNLLRLDLGYLRNLKNEIMDGSFASLTALRAIELTCLPKLTNIDFLSGATKLEYLEMNTLKRLESFKPLEELRLRFLKATGFLPADKNCDYLHNTKFLLLDTGYDSESKLRLINHFTGDSLFIGKYIKQTPGISPLDFWEEYKPQHLLLS